MQTPIQYLAGLLFNLHRNQNAWALENNRDLQKFWKGFFYHLLVDVFYNYIIIFVSLFSNETLHLYTIFAKLY